MENKIDNCDTDNIQYILKTSPDFHLFSKLFVVSFDKSSRDFEIFYICFF